MLAEAAHPRSGGCVIKLRLFPHLYPISAEGWAVSRKRVYRLYRRDKLSLRSREAAPQLQCSLTAAGAVGAQRAVVDGTSSRMEEKPGGSTRICVRFEA